MACLDLAARTGGNVIKIPYDVRDSQWVFELAM
jgi:hypothetical protein